MVVVKHHKRDGWAAIGPILVIAGVGVLLTLPMLLNGYLQAHDFQFHLVYSQHFSEQFWQGDWYPRWLRQMNAGLGSPTFFFYAPLPYYITSLCTGFSRYTTASFNTLSVSCAIALIASGLSARLWLKEIVSPPVATIAAIFYMAWPYHLAIDLYSRFAFAEYWSFVWIPLALYYSRKLASGKWFYLLGLAISFSLLALTHLPTFIISFPVVMQYAMFKGERGRKTMLFCRLLLAVGLMIGLSAIYWVPAMTTQSAVAMDAILTKEYYYANNFLFSGPKYLHNQYFWRYLEIFTGLSALFAGFAWQLAGQSATLDALTKRERHYWGIVVGCAMFLMLPLSQVVWAVLPLFQRVQFPWRFHTVVTVGLTALLAMAIPQMQCLLQAGARRQWLRLLPLMGVLVLGLIAINLLPSQEKVAFFGSQNTVLLIGLIVGGLVTVSPILKMLRSPVSQPLLLSLVLLSAIFWGSTAYAAKPIFWSRLNDPNQVPRIQISQGADEHRPQWVPKGVFQPDRLAQLSNDLPPLQVNQGEATGIIQRWQPRQLVMAVNAATDSQLTLRQFYYPGWQAMRLNGPQLLSTQASPLGLLQIAIPKGQYQLIATLGTTASERIGQILSVMSGGLILGLMGVGIRQWYFTQLQLLHYQDWALSPTDEPQPLPVKSVANRR